MGLLLKAFILRGREENFIIINDMIHKETYGRALVVDMWR